MNILKHIKQKSDRKKPQTAGSFLKEGFAFLKGIGNLVKGKDTEKEDDDSFQSIQEMTTLMSNLSVPTEFSLPIIKKLLEGR